MSTYISMFDLGYPKPWIWNADASVTFISGGSNTVTGTQCPTIDPSERGSNKFWNITRYDDDTNKFVVHKTLGNTLPQERLLITLNNGISLFNIDDHTDETCPTNVSILKKFVFKNVIY